MSFHYNKTSPFGRAHGDILSRVDSTTEEDKEKVVAELKSRGNAAFKSKRPEEAHLLYSAALHIDDQNWAIFGNRSAVNEMMGKGEEALEDANSATEWWDEISQTERESIERGLKDSQAGNTIPHNQVQARYAKYL